MANTTSDPVAGRLIALQDAIKAVDAPPEDKNNMLGKTYELTWNKALGFGHHPETYHMFLPYGTWAKYSEVNSINPGQGVQSLLAAGFKDVLAQEYVQPLPSSGNFFIDIACLGDLDLEFMTQRNNGGESVAEAIASLVNGIKNPAVTPIMRILIGKDAMNKSKMTNSDINDTYRKIFWTGNNQPRIDNDRAVLYVGRYAPDFSHP
jgi:hypothetical protein